MKDGLNVLLYARSRGRRRHLAFLHNTQIKGWELNFLGKAAAYNKDCYTIEKKVDEV